MIRALLPFLVMKSALFALILSPEIGLMGALLFFGLMMLVYLGLWTLAFQGHAVLMRRITRDG